MGDELDVPTFTETNDGAPCAGPGLHNMTQRPSAAEILPSHEAVTLGYRHAVMAALSALVGKTVAHCKVYTENLTHLLRTVESSVDITGTNYQRSIDRAWVICLDSLLQTQGEARWELSEAWQKYRTAVLPRTEVSHVDGGGRASGETVSREIAPGTARRDDDAGNQRAARVSAPKVPRRKSEPRRGIRRDANSRHAPRRAGRGRGQSARKGKD